MLNRLVVIISTRNEEETIKSVIKQIPKNLALDTKVIVIDKSKDATPIIAQRAGALVIRQLSGGLGAAFHLGVEKGLKLNADVVVHIDGDMQYNPEEMPLILKPILSGKADMVLGRRILEYNMPLIRRIGNRFFSWLVSRLSNVLISDAQTGYRALNRKALEALLALKGSYTYTQESILIVAKRGLKISEVPVIFRERAHGQSFISLFRYPIKVLAILTRAYFMEVSEKCYNVQQK